MDHKSEIKIAAKTVDKWHIMPGDKGVEFNVTTDNETCAAISFPLDNLLGIIGVCSMATYSICKATTGAIPWLEVEAVRASRNQANIGLELAFGKHGILNFEMIVEQATTLRDDLSRYIAASDISGPAQPQSH